MNSAGHHSMMGGRRKPTAKDYVQLGLAAMWDSIENVGWGQHDNNAVSWVDLMGGRTAVLSGGTWHDNYLAIGNNNATWAGQFEELSSYTLEFIFDGVVSEASTYATPLTCTTDSVSFFRRDGAWWEMKTAGRQRMRLAPFLMKPYYCQSDNGSGKAGYYDGSYTTTGEQGVFNQTGSLQIGGNAITFVRYLGESAKYYALRIYSRALTADEIARNYAIDKSRFNLP